MPTKKEYWNRLDYYRSAAENKRRNDLIKRYMAEGKCRCGRELIEGAGTKTECIICVEGGTKRRTLSRWR